MNRRTQSSLPRRRFDRIRRRLTRPTLLVLLLGTLAVADRAGLFGLHQEDDWSRYHDKKTRVVHIVDGDTIDVAMADGDFPRTRIRLWGVDTPETVKPDHPVQHFGPEASEFTTQRAFHKTVRLELLPHDTRDKYGRLLAYIYLPDGSMLNRQLVEQGYAFADPRFEHKYLVEFRQLMRRARQAGRGLWAKPHPEDWPGYLD